MGIAEKRYLLVIIANSYANFTTYYAQIKAL